jgi:excisionase family DNA binding protein
MELNGLPVVDDLVRRINDAVVADTRRLNTAHCTLDMHFVAYLRLMSRFGYFSFGPVNLDVRLLEDIVERTAPRLPEGSSWDTRWDLRPASDDFVRFSQRLMAEVRTSGRRRIDELHYLLAFMRTDEGLPKRVFGELGVTPQQVEEYAANRGLREPPLERLFSPEEAADYLNVHVQTVRAWIRSGRLKARRLAGQRALRVTASELLSVLEPVEAGDVD